MLMNGGTQTDVELLLRSLQQHEHRRFLSQFGKRKTGAQIEQDVEEFSENHHDTAYRDLAKSWPDAKAPMAEADPGKKVVDLVRCNIRSELRDSFEEFMADLNGVESAWLLNDILQNVNSGGEYADLAFSFDVAIDRSDETYIRVPWNFRKKVREFIALLDKRAA
jgi:hypothetical protein